MKPRTAAPAPTLADVIEVPPIRLVMQLSDGAEAVADTFVLTAEVEAYLRPLVDSLRSGAGVGCFVKGHYGSGKSHFLSFLALLAQGHAGAWSVLSGWPQTGRYLVVPIALQNYSAAYSLEDIVGEAAEATLHAQLGRREVLSDHHFLLDNFNRLLLGEAADFLQRHGHSPEAWVQWSQQNRLPASRLVAEYLANLPHNPLRTRSHRARALEALVRAGREGGRSGVLLLFDELSEYLKARPSAREANDDLRYLQFLGEATDKHPLWVVATLQETIEDLGWEDHELYTRIKERYRLRFSLSPRHVEDLVEKRLVRKKPGAEQHIEAAWKLLNEAYPQLGWTRERFYRIYPVHPSTLTMLENLMSLFSRHRGVVDFVHTRLAGNPAAGVPGMLGESPNRLLTCESIFDHFKERIGENVAHAPYINTAWRFLEQDMPRLFETQRDRDLASRCVKIMILTELSPLERPRTVRELSALVVRPASTISPEVALSYLKERILDRLVGESSYVKCQPAADPFDAVYTVDVQANTAQQLEARLRQARRGLDVGPDLWMRILKLVELPYLPLSELAGDAYKFKHLYWQFTAREGSVQLSDLRSVAVDGFNQAVAGLETSERDWLLLLGTPHEVEAQKEQVRRLFDYARNRRFAPTVAAWVPKEPPSAGLEACQRAVALLQVVEQSRREGGPAEAMALLAEEQSKAAMAHLREVVVECYNGGEVLFASGESDRAQELGIHSFDRMALALFGRGLEKLYPQHARIHPMVAEHRLEDLERAWSLAIVSGRISKEAAVQQAVDKQLESVALRLGLVRKVGSDYVVEPQVQTHPLLAELTAAILPGQTVRYHTLYQTFRKGPWGIGRELFAFTLSVLAWEGCCSLYHEGRAEAAKGPRQLYSHKVDEIGEGRVLDRAERERLPLLRFLLPEGALDGQFSLAHQRELWHAAGRSAETLKLDLNAVAGILERHQGYQAFARLPVDELRQTVAHLMEVLKVVRPGLDAKDGLVRLLGAVAMDSAERYAWLARWREFLTTSLDAYIRLYQAVSGFTGDMPVELQSAWTDLKRTLSSMGDVVEGGRWPPSWQAWLQFRERYVDWYRTAHEAWYSQPHFEALNRLSQAADYRLLERLSRLYAVEVDVDVVGVRRALAQLPRPCKANVAEALALGWKCGCGFEPGQAAELPSADHLSDWIRQGLQGYERYLERPETREKLEVHVANLRHIGQQERARQVTSLAVACRKGRLHQGAAAALGTVNDTVLEEVNRALAGQPMVIERSLAELVAALEGRRVSPARLRETFERWLGNVRPDAWVQLGPVSETVGSLIDQAVLEDELPAMRAAELVALLGQDDVVPEVRTMANELLAKHAVSELDAAALRTWSLAPGVGEGTAALLHLLALARVAPTGAVEQYLGGLAEVPWAVDRVRQAQFEHRDVVEYVLREAAEQAEAVLAAAEARFEGEASALPSLADVVERCLVGRPQPWVILLMDAMRWDVWERFRSEFETALSGHRLEQIEPVVALTPTVTATNRSALLGEVPFTIVAAAEKASKRDEVRQVLSDGGPVRVVHFNLVDERIHESDAGPFVLYQELLLALRQRVLPYLSDVPPGATVLIIADHGFVYREGAYSHGGATMFERIVPAARFVPR